MNVPCMSVHLKMKRIWFYASVVFYFYSLYILDFALFCLGQGFCEQKYRASLVYAQNIYSYHTAVFGLAPVRLMNHNQSSICILLSGVNAQQQRLHLLQALSECEALQQLDFYIVHDDNWSSDILANLNLHENFCTRAIAGDLSFHDLVKLHEQLNFDCIAAHDAHEHRLAISLKHSEHNKPVFVIRHRIDFEAVPGTRQASRFHNKQTDINCFYNLAAKQPYIEGRDGTQGLDNPYMLEQPQLGENYFNLMLEHMFLSLLCPTRNHSVGGSKQSFSHIKLSYVTHFYCNQQGISSVTELLEKYSGYSPALLEKIHFVIVDDGSPIDYEVPDLPLNLTWLKITDDIRWNQAGARNLGVLYAKSDTVITTDLDHEFPEETFRQVMQRKAPGKRIYKFFRQQSDGSLKRGHPNIFLFSRARFFKYFGYDEEFAGGYGAEDARFVKFQKLQGTNHWHLPKRIFCSERVDIDRDRQYHSLFRDHSFNTPIDARKKAESEYYGHALGHSRMMLNFTWSTLRENWLAPSLKPKVDRGWRLRWLLRQLIPF